MVRGIASACQCRRHGFDPWSGKIHMPQSNYACSPQLLPLCSRAWKPQLLKPPHPGARAPHQGTSPQWEARTPHLEWPLLAATTEKSTQLWGPSTAKNKQINKKNFLKTTNYESSAATILLPVCVGLIMSPNTPSSSDLASTCRAPFPFPHLSKL